MKKPALFKEQSVVNALNIGFNFRLPLCEGNPTKIRHWRFYKIQKKNWFFFSHWTYMGKDALCQNWRRNNWFITGNRNHESPLFLTLVFSVSVWNIQWRTRGRDYKLPYHYPGNSVLRDIWYAHCGTGVLYEPRCVVRFRAHLVSLFMRILFTIVLNV